MTVRGFVDCACAEFQHAVMPEAGPRPVWLYGQGGMRQALKLLLVAADDWKMAVTPTDAGGDPGRLRYHGGIHVDGIHVTMIYDDAGRPLLPSNAGFYPADYAALARGRT